MQLSHAVSSVRESSVHVPRGLYLITPATDSLSALQSAVLPVYTQAVLIQLRCKSPDARLCKAQAEWLRMLTLEHGIPFIVNDDIELAFAVRADGVHLGREDGAIETARRALGAEAMIGASCYNDFALAEAAWQRGANYVAFGAVFGSPTKPQAPRASLDLFKQARAAGMHSVAIGGITPETIDKVVEAGADLAAVISGIYAAADPAIAAAHCAAAFETH